MQKKYTVSLDEFIEASKSKGASDQFLASLLMRRGWPEDDVYAALGDYWQRLTGVTVPERASGESSRDAFLYLLSFSTLATWSSALGSILFRFIDHWFPDPVTLEHVYNLRNAVTWQMASIAVAFPIFLLVMRAILHEAKEQPERLQSGVRKWLTYIALLLTASAMICDLIWFFDYFLNGELTSRFILKALTVMVICGTILIYYLGSLRWDGKTNMSAAKTRSLRFGIAACAAVVSTFCIGLGVAGTPSAQRHVEADNRRVKDLKAIAWAIHARQQRTANQPSSNPPVAYLPSKLSDLLENGLTADHTIDPETRAPYEYHVQAGPVYELCATFSDVTEAGQTVGSHFWDHTKGRTCFTLTALQTPVW